MFIILLTWILTALALMLTSYLVAGFQITSFGGAMIASVLIGFLNAILRPILLFLTLPINFITLGLFTFVVNAIILRLAAGLMSSFSIDGWISAIIGALVLAVVQMIISVMIPGKM